MTNASKPQVLLLLLSLTVPTVNLLAASRQESTSVAAMMANGKYAQAVHQLARIAPQERSVKQTLQLATCYKHLQYYDSAKQTLETLDERAQQRLDVVLLYVDIDAIQSQWENAAQRLQAVADRYASHPDFVLRYAQVHQALGNSDKADAAFTYYGVLRNTAAQGIKQ